VNDAAHADLVEMRAAHVNAGWPADFTEDVRRGLSDHDPQVARFSSRAALSVNDVSVREGNSGLTDARFTVTMSRPLSQNVTVCLVPFGITAQPNTDFVATPVCGTLAAGQSSIDLAIPVRGNRAREPDETFGVVAAASGGVRLADPLGIGTIVNDD
jgi:hypothetical protein